MSGHWTKKELFLFRFFAVYFFFYLVFVGQPFGSYYQALNIYQYTGKIVFGITESSIQLINYLFLHRPINSNVDISGDSYWGYIIVISFSILAMIIALLWSAFEKRSSHGKLFWWMHTIARYYLAFTLFYYGISKLFGNQFFIPDWGLITNLSDLIPQHLLWSFMASSKSYQFVGGLMEVIPAILLLFRRTYTIGAIMAILVLLNVLMLNIGYDVGLKLILLHLIVFGVFILTPNIKRLFRFFFRNQIEQLHFSQPVIFSNRKWAYYTIKFGLIFFILYVDLKYDIEHNNAKTSFPKDSVFGMHTINNFYFKRQSQSKITESLYWKKMAIYSNNQALIQFMNDSILSYPIKLDTVLKSMEVFLNDNAFCKLNYTRIKPDHWEFEGILKTDSVSFASKKIDLNKTPLRKAFGKTKWVH